MAAPGFEGVLAGATDAGGAWTYAAGGAVGNVIIFQVLQDGATAGAVTLTATVAIVALDGTANAMTYVGAFQVGGTSLAIQHLWVGRISAAGAKSISGGNSTSEDLYMRAYEFNTVSTGTTLATVIENVTAAATTTSEGTSATASDASVTTIGPDRLALNFLAINDDNAFAGFSGESGGPWTNLAGYADAGGTDGAVYLSYCQKAAAGTIDGGTGSITDSDAWGVVGFALIGTTPDVAVYVPRHPAINHQDPALV
jgi:hypothetical protein